MAKKKSAEQVFAEAHGLTQQQMQAIDDRFSGTPENWTQLPGFKWGEPEGKAKKKPTKKAPAKKATAKKKK